MNNFEREQQLRVLFEGALLASILASPRDAGLTDKELREFGTRKGFYDGEMGDALKAYSTNFALRNRDRYLPPTHLVIQYMLDLNERWDDDPRDFDACVIVHRILTEVVAKAGRSKAVISREVLVERAVAAGGARDGCEVAVETLRQASLLKEEQGILKVSLDYSAPAGHPHLVQQPHPASAVLPDVRDICARRTDGRPASADPFKAFAEHLPALGFPLQQMWWAHMLSELRQIDPNKTPTAVLVTAAALAEGALSFVLRHARQATNDRVFPKLDPSKPTTWTFLDLAKGARSGDADRIISDRLYETCARLNTDRQRIHAARFIDTAKTLTELDIHPHEAADAVQTATRLLSAIVDWLAVHPPAGPKL